MTAPAKPDINDLISWIAPLCNFGIERDKYYKAILDKLEAHKRIIEATETFVPKKVACACDGWAKCQTCGGSGELDVYGPDLLAAYHKARAKRDELLWHKDDARVQKNRAETAERQLADSEEENKRLLQANRDCVDHFNELLRDYKQRSEQLAECRKECEEQARLNGMGSEREARLMAQLAELREKYERKTD